MQIRVVIVFYWLTLSELLIKLGSKNLPVVFSLTRIGGLLVWQKASYMTNFSWKESIKYFLYDKSTNKGKMETDCSHEKREKKEGKSQCTFCLECSKFKRNSWKSTQKKMLILLMFRYIDNEYYCSSFLQEANLSLIQWP